MLHKEYAKAIYELSLEEKKDELFLECFNSVIETALSSELNDVLTSPFIDLNKKKKLIDEVYSSLDLTFINFIKVLLDNNRFNLVSEIYEEYKNLLLANNDIVKIQVVSANQLSSMELIKLTKSLQSKYKNKKIELENIIDEKLIGGIQIISNGQSIDMSLKNSLLKLKESL